MREEIAIIAGPRDWGDTRESWLNRASLRVRTVPYRMMKSLWYGEITNANHWAARDIKRAVAIIEAQRDLRKSRERNEILSRRLDVIDPDFHQPSIAAHRGLASGYGGEDKPGTDSRAEIKLGFDPPK